MSPTLFTVNNNLNLGEESKKSEQKGDLKHFFVIREQSDPNRIVFSVVLKNNHHSIINRVWFSSFIGIPSTKFAPSLDEQVNFHTKNSNLGGGSYLSGYTKDEVKFVPESIMEILYFDIPKDKLSGAGSLEYCFGCESVKKISFKASWDDDEIGRHLKEINSKNFINFLKYKNHKTIWRRVALFAKTVYKFSKRTLKSVKGLFVREKEF
ncbi:MAG: hypothetical protein HQ402_01570 [Parcubacteria group bacterium]|nr:hypothetical protein [Parcubacteria group bacterium]